MGWVRWVGHHHRADKTQNLVVILVFFDWLTFPLLKRLTSVLTCTSDTIWLPPPLPTSAAAVASNAEASASLEALSALACCKSGSCDCSGVSSSGRNFAVEEQYLSERWLYAMGARPFCSLDAADREQGAAGMLPADGDGETMASHRIAESRGRSKQARTCSARHMLAPFPACLYEVCVCEASS